MHGKCVRIYEIKKEEAKVRFFMEAPFYSFFLSKNRKITKGMEL